MASVKPMVPASYAVSRELQQAMQRPDMVRRALTMRDAMKRRGAAWPDQLAPSETTRQVPAGVAYALGRRRVSGNGTIVPVWLVQMPADGRTLARSWGKELWLFDEEKPTFKAVSPFDLVSIRGGEGIPVYTRPAVGASVPTLDEGPSGDAELSENEYFEALAFAPVSQIVRGRVVSVEKYPGTDRIQSFTVQTPSGSRAKVSRDYDGRFPIPAWIEPETGRSLAARDNPTSEQQTAEEEFPRWDARRRARNEADDRQGSITSQARFAGKLAFEDMTASELSSALAAAWSAAIGQGEDATKAPLLKLVAARVKDGRIPAGAIGPELGDPRTLAWILKDASERFTVSEPIMRAQVGGPSPQLDAMRASRAALVRWVKGTNASNAEKRVEACCSSCASGKACESVSGGLTGAAPIRSVSPMETASTKAPATAETSTPTGEDRPRAMILSRGTQRAKRYTVRREGAAESETERTVNGARVATFHTEEEARKFLQRRMYVEIPAATKSEERSASELKRTEAMLRALSEGRGGNLGQPIESAHYAGRIRKDAVTRLNDIGLVSMGTGQKKGWNYSLTRDGEDVAQEFLAAVKSAAGVSLPQAERLVRVYLDDGKYTDSEAGKGWGDNATDGLESAGLVTLYDTTVRSKRTQQYVMVKGAQLSPKGEAAIASAVAAMVGKL